ncbi:hypothetical protein [uncultured Anaerotruncus sp.]|uniref:hypothetical protein n=1 Tax=uncultured Anaerotruncus sp. TaxID=905011 RepID=UPI00280AAB79|nr:hypothetical protein [uncultured Anaerotruncus sp.]
MDTWSNSVGNRGGSGVGRMMQQVKLPRSTLSGQSSSFMQELTMSLTGWTSYGYNMSLTWGDTVYVQVGNNMLTYNRITKTQGEKISMAGNYSDSMRFIPIIVDQRAFLLSGSGGYFSVLDLASGQVTKLSSPPFSGSFYNDLSYVLPVMRYDRTYNKIYAAIPIRYYSNGSSYGYELTAYDVASNTWTLLYRNKDSFSLSNYQGKGCLIDFNEDTVKFVCNMGRISGNPWSFTTPRNASPSGGVFNATETVYTKLQGHPSNDYTSAATIVQTDDKVFGLQGSKLFTFDLFTGETSDESLFGAVPVSNSGSFPAAQAYGCNYCNGKLWYCDGQRLFSLDYDLTVKPDGPLVWKIFKGQKYSAPDPITLHKLDGSTLEITPGQQEAISDIEIHIGEYDNNQTDKYLLIEN